LETSDRGLRIRKTGAGIELVTAPDCGTYLQKVRRKEDKLSKAALETLAVVAFKQPVTKSEVEELRGVNCEKVLKQLLSRALITELGHKDTVGRPTLYGTTDEFLRSVGIDSIDDLQASLDVEYAIGSGPQTYPGDQPLFAEETMSPEESLGFPMDEVDKANLD
ncbi:MAG: SMC-Scp complex subunit ScpB, partial [Veillonella sp.]|nr:SMC-Scp complex subunit ScpB [Veillonella sp.]